MALFGGLMISGGMMGPKRESGMYRLDINNKSKWVADKAATAYLETMMAKDGRAPEEASCRREIIAHFLADVQRVRWTWNSELEWKATKKEKASPAP